MADTISDEKTIKLAQEKSESPYEPKNESQKGVKDQVKKIRKTFAHMVVDFKIIPYVVSFAIAMSFSGLMQKLSLFLIRSIKLKDTNDLLSSFLSFVLILVISYVFGYLIFYKYIYTEDIAKENIVKKVINKEKEREVEKTIKKDKETKRDVEKAGELKIETFNSKSLFLSPSNYSIF